MASSSAAAAAAAPRVAARARPRASSSSRASASAASTARRRASAAAAAPSAPSSELSWPDATATATCDGDLAVVASVVNLGARGVIATGLPFLDHMIDQLTSHAQLGVSVIVTEGATAREPCVDASGSDDERVASVAGEALGSALRAFLAPGIARTRDGTVAPDAASAVFAAPLDEAYSWCDLNASPETPGRLDFELAPYGPASSPGGIGRTRIGTYQTKLTEPFFAALTEASGVAMHIQKCRGDNAHHITEASFKAFARCLRAAMDSMEGVDVVSMNAKLEGVTRSASRARATKETDIDVFVDLDGAPDVTSVSTGIATLDALLCEIAAHGGVQLNVKATGDLWIDDHHTTEDVAITIGQVLCEALGDKAGCNRMGRAVAAVLDGGDVDAADAADAAVVEAVMDLSNRPYLENGVEFRDEFIGDLSAEMIDHLFMSVTANGQMTVHLVQHAAGKSDGDLAVAAARAFGRCLRQCVAVDPRRAGAVASSKGTLSV